MQQLFLIDGYNVVHFCPRLLALAQNGFEDARDALIELVSQYCATSGNAAKVVFDGRGRHAQRSKPFRSGPGLEVLYSPEHLAADTVIERIVYNTKLDRKDIVVVTGDMGIRDLCRAMGSLVMAPANFLAFTEERMNRSRDELHAATESYRRSMLEDRLDETSLERLRAWKNKLQK